MNVADRHRRAPSTLVLGLGKTGYSVIEHLAARGERITAADSRDLAPYLARVRADYPQVELITGRLPLDSLAAYDRVVVSPGVEVPSAALADCAQPPVGDIELFALSARAPIIAITGSNGKSTATMLVARMLAAAGKTALAGGNLGTPALCLLTRPTPDFYVLEASSFQLASTYRLRARASSILNISEDHLDRHGSIERYIAAKARILNGARARVLNRQDRASAQLLQVDSDAITFGLDRPSSARDYGVADGFLCRGETRLAPTSRMTMPGAQNIANVLAALALVEAVGIVPTQSTKATDAVLAAALDYRGLAHRCEPVAEINGVRWINDSKGTNVGAAIAAIEGLAREHELGCLILIAGGRGKGADFAPLAAAMRARVSHAVLFGEDAARIEDAIARAGVAAQVIRARDLAQAVSRGGGGGGRGGRRVVFSVFGKFSPFF
ncbi:MAG: UDP-N-acetylmuramoyl-L-alanine--D-glutamate ligase, partial [bacterium]